MAEGGEPDYDLDEEIEELSDKDLAAMAKVLARSGKFNVTPLSTGGNPREAEPVTERKTHFATSTPGIDGASFAFPPAYQQPPRISMFSGDEPAPKGRLALRCGSTR